MKKSLTLISILALSMSLLASESPTTGFNNKIPQKIMTPDRVETHIGTLDFYDGVPTP